MDEGAVELGSAMGVTARPRVRIWLVRGGEDRMHRLVRRTSAASCVSIGNCPQQAANPRGSVRTYSKSKKSAGGPTAAVAVEGKRVVRRGAAWIRRPQSVPQRSPG